MMFTAVVCSALLGVLVFGLGFAVSITRGRTQTVAGHSSDPTDRLHKLVRAHGNTCEYAPMLAVLMLIVGMSGPATWVLWVMGIAVASRYALVAGLLLGKSLEQAHPLRFAGALGTYVTGLVLCVRIVM
jgi:uncharacterized membrane protein YecN with MAPEG domain